MKTGHAWIAAVLAAVGLVGVSSTAAASSHREAPAISRDPAADNLDFWAWHTGDAATGSLHVVASYDPLQQPAGGPNFNTFSDDVLYEVHVARGSESLADVVTYQFKFTTTKAPYAAPTGAEKVPAGGVEFFAQISGSSQTYTVTQLVAGVPTVLAKDIPVPIPNIGPRTQAGLMLDPSYETYATGGLHVGNLTGGGKVWAGSRDDGFYVDLGGIFDLANVHSLAGAANAPDGLQRDNVAGFNCSAITFNVPFANIPKVKDTDPFKNRLGTWASASRRKVAIYRNDGSRQWLGPWVQVSRQGQPLINEVVIGLQDKDKYNRTYPKDDVANFGGYILNPIIVRDAEFVGTYTQLNIDPNTPNGQMGIPSLKTGRVDIVGAINILDGTFPLGASGDVLRVDPDATGGKAGYPNGRPLGPTLTGAANKENDVTDIIASIFLLGTTFAATNGFPYKDLVNTNDRNYTDTIPYLGSPWRGWDEGIGKAAPLSSGSSAMHIRLLGYGPGAGCLLCGRRSRVC